MTIVFVSVVLNIHQVGIADELYYLTNGSFWFIETGNTDGDNNKGGDSNTFKKRPYLIAGNNFAYKEKVNNLILNADVMIYGAAPLTYLKERVKTSKLTFLYSEHWFKQGWKNLFSPNLIKQMWLYHTKCHNKPLYLLGASAYAAKDFNLMGAFKDKAFKWGYFTQCPDLNIENVLRDKSNDCKIRILWCGRFIDWKHPEVMVSLAEKLRDLNIDFQINMIGTGTLYGKILLGVQEKGLKNYINLLGSMPNTEVTRIMQTQHIACFTSDRNEGWGAVLNEAMSRGCCPVSSIDTGSTPYLITNGVNGLSFNLRKENDLFNRVLWLIQNPKELERMTIEAYRTIHDVWSPQNAANNFYKLAESILNGTPIIINNGPCSKA